jgi:hypothetical protein
MWNLASVIKGNILRALENRVVTSVFGVKRDEVPRGRRKPHNKELRNSYSSPNMVGNFNSRIKRESVI